MVERECASIERVFHALSDASRRAILARFATGKRTIGELGEPLPMSLAAVSKHVKILEETGLVRRKIQWRRHVCSLNAEPLAAAQRWLDFYEQFWDGRLNALEKLFHARRNPKNERPNYPYVQASYPWTA